MSDLEIDEEVRKIINESYKIAKVVLLENKIIRRKTLGVKLLGSGDLKTKMTITVCKASATALKAIENLQKSLKGDSKTILGDDKESLQEKIDKYKDEIKEIENNIALINNNEYINSTFNINLPEDINLMINSFLSSNMEVKFDNRY